MSQAVTEASRDDQGEHHHADPRGGRLFALRRLIRQPQVDQHVIEAQPARTLVTIPETTLPITTASSTTISGADDIGQGAP